MKYLYVVFMCFACSISFSQEEQNKIATNFINSNQIFKNYPKEKFFLHTNKTTYFSGESINYKAYVVDDDTNLPSYITTNLNISMYNSDKELMKHQLILVENGTVYGGLELEKDLKSGTYYMVLDTNYNASFNNKNISEIQIINLEDKKVNIVEDVALIEAKFESKGELQVAFFPESEVLLSGANNTMYYKISLGGSPIEAKGELINSMNKVVLGKLNTNKEGIGSVNFVYYPEQEYYFEIFHDQKTYEFKVPRAQDEGFVIHHEASKSNLKEVSFVIRINNHTAIENKKETILAVIHRNNTCKSVIPFKIDKDKNDYLLNIKKENLFNGVNMITLFNNKNEAISSRSFFYDKNSNVELSIAKVAETKDSLTIDLKMLNRYTTANTSVSILPEQNVINTTSETIYNAFLINPYVSKINNPKDIDLALQFVSQINDINETENNVQIRDLENGISVSGEVITSLPNLNGYKVLFSSKENGVALVENIENKNTFSFNNLLLYHPSKFELALLSPSGKVVDANFNVVDQKLNYPIDSILIIKPDVLIKQDEKLIEENDESGGDDKFNVVFEGEKLDEVELMAKKRNEEVSDEFPDFGIIDNPGELGNGFIRKIVKKDIECMGCTLFEYLDQIWYLETYLDLLGDPHVFFKTRGINTVFGSKDALLIVDGLPMFPTILLDIMANDVKAVKLNRAGAGYGIRGSNGVIMVELKKPEDYLNSDQYSGNETKTFSSNTTFGFTKSIDLFTENSLIFKSQNSLEKFSVIDWLPNFTLSPNSSNYIKIKKENYTGLKLIINGFNNEGDMVSEEVNIPIK